MSLSVEVGVRRIHASRSRGRATHLGQVCERLVEHAAVVARVQVPRRTPHLHGTQQYNLSIEQLPSCMVLQIQDVGPRCHAHALLGAAEAGGSRRNRQ